MPSISVIVPVYKVENYLRRCVDSILCQTFRDFELILVDDGSPDNCGAMCEAYAAQHPFIYVIHQENGGLSAARNTGIDWAFAHSDSEYLAFVDSDDWLAPEYLDFLYRAVRDTGCAVSACGLERTAQEISLAGQSYEVQKIAADDYYCSKNREESATAVAVCKLYRRDLFSQLRYPVGKLHEDEFTTYRIVYEAKQVAVIPARLYAYFQNDAGIMRSHWSPRRMHALEAMEQQMAYAQDRDLPRLLDQALEQYLFATSSQLTQAQSEYQGILRSKLRWGLKKARKRGIFHEKTDITWMYELAYPMKPVWWLVFKIKARMGR